LKEYEMRSWLLAGVVALGSALSLMPLDADARRFGGGGFSGMQRSAPAKPAPAAPQQAAPATPAAGGAAAAAGGRSWMGPIAGLAAGLGIAALMSHLGMGEAFGNFLMLALLVVGGIFLARMLMRRMAPAAPIGAGAGVGAGNVRAASGPTQRFEGLPMPRSGEASAPASVPTGASVGAASSAWAGAAALPADFDRDGFERIAKMIFIRMQTANDAGDLNDLRNFTTPEMFAVCKLELQDRDNKPQTTDVVRVDAEVLDLEKQGERQVVSVRFHGLIREEVGAEATAFDEIWHLVRWGDNPSWAIAGIQQQQ
jgi:predicted lipid-binding transport protein (Tim44 family)